MQLITKPDGWREFFKYLSEIPTSPTPSSTSVSAENWLGILERHNPTRNTGIPGWVLNAFSEYAKQVSGNELREKDWEAGFDFGFDSGRYPDKKSEYPSKGEYLSLVSDEDKDVGHGKCSEGGCDKFAVKDYNGHGKWVCQSCYDSLSDHFDKEYA